MSRSNSFRHRRTVIGIALCATLGIVGAASVAMRSNASWARAQQITDELQAQWDQRSFMREPLWGHATGDRAFDHYGQAMALASELHQDQTALIDFWRKRHEAPTEATTSLRARWEPVVAKMRVGAHARDTRPVRVGTPHVHTTSLLSCRWIVNFAVDAAEQAGAQGRGKEAVEITLDALTFARDVMSCGSLIDQMVGSSLLAIVCMDGWTENRLANVDKDCLAALADGLDRLDKVLPTSLDCAGEMLHLASSMGEAPIRASGNLSWEAWRFGFSTRWMLGDAVAHAAAFAQTMDGQRSLAWPDRQGLIQAETTRMLRRGNAMLDLMIPNYDAAERSLREALANFQLLRLSIAVHQGAASPEFADPFGAGPLAMLDTGNGTTLRSVGQGTRKAPERTVIR